MRVYQVKNRRLQLQHEQVSHYKLQWKRILMSQLQSRCMCKKKPLIKMRGTASKCAKAAVVSHVAQRVTVTYSIYLSLSVLVVKQA